MTCDRRVTVRVLDRFAGKGCDPAVAEVVIPDEGCSARLIAETLELRLEMISGVQVHHQIYSLDHTVHSGDLLSFIPVRGDVATGTPSRRSFERRFKQFPQ